MKMVLLNLFLILLLLNNIYGQQLENGNFEQWDYVHTYSDGEIAYKPVNWTLYSYSPEATYYYGDRLSVKNGKYAICIQSLGGNITGKAYPSYLSYGNTVGKRHDSNPQKWGVAYSSRPIKVLGEYKFYNDEHPEDAGFAFVLLKKYDVKKQKSDTLGYGTYTFPITKGSKPWDSVGYLPFEMEIKYNDNTTQPDTMALVFVDSKYQVSVSNKYNGGLFFIDNVSIVEEINAVSYADDVKAALTLYPNPASGQLHIGNARVFNKFIIYQSNGTKVLESQATANLDVSVLPAGLYLLEAWDSEERRVVKKFEKR